MANKPISVVDPRLKRMKKKKKPTSKRRRVKSALKAIFNYMKSDSYMFAPFIHHHQIQSSTPLSYAGELLSLEPTKKKLGEEVNDYLKCDAYMYAPLASMDMDSGTTNPSSESARVSSTVRRVVIKDSERIEHILRRRPFSSKACILSPFSSSITS